MTQNDIKNIRKHIQNFQFEDLFIEELGWDYYNQSLNVLVEGEDIPLTGVAQKRGLVAFILDWIPESKIRRKIEKQVAKTYRENIIIYTDETKQIWQWVRREPGKPLANREKQFSRGQSGDALARILKDVAFSLDEEDSLTLVDVTSRVRAAFDMERVTRRFYDRFKRQHDVFLNFIQGIPDEEMHRWYASVMINRIMFIYFVQSKGFLDGDLHYLKNRLAKTDGNFYLEFLCPLFFEGFAKKEHTPKIKQLLGDVPYLNGGLFLKHQIEELYGEAIQIENEAFETLFDFLDAYDWRLDDRPLRDDSQINPDVLGYIFEKYINQKQMGAYYTKEDITDYISKNTIIPFIFDAARKDVPIAFEGEHTIWDLLTDDTDRYIYPAVRHGAELPLPENIAIGLEDVSQRGDWNTPAPSDYGLPTEIWRETVARRKRCEEVRDKLVNGEVRQINDLITLNLDIQQFAQDVIDNVDSPDVIRALWKALNRVTVLDPTCGSGAFLFAALNILEPLYEACLERMEQFLNEAETMGHERHYTDFREVKGHIKQHPNRRYFILKSIIVQNLYGVDIMEEAVEIAKLRLFLKLMSHVDDKNRIEPLPDIDFNIRAGNTLVGFATRAEIEADFFARGILPRLKVLTGTLNTFRREQLEVNISPEQMRDSKQNIISKTREIVDVLDSALAPMHGFGTDQVEKFRVTHKPFHWYAEFYGIVEGGGFDVIIGNPPYLELRQIDYNLLNYKTESPVHSICIERSLQLLCDNGCISMIVPLALVSTQRMKIVQQLLEEQRSTWYSNFAWRPAKLFDQVNRALTIFIASSSPEPKTYSTNYQKWTSEIRETLISLISYIEISKNREYFYAPKFGDKVETDIFTRLLASDSTIGNFVTSNNKNPVYYRTTGGLYWKIFTDFAPSFIINGEKGHSSRETTLNLQYKDVIYAVIATLSSNIFWWWYTITSNLRDLNPSDIQGFPIHKLALYDDNLSKLGLLYLEDMQSNSTMLVRLQRQTGRTETQSFKVRLSKPIIDEIDRLLARHYGFTDEELDFIINYDIKYRMGDDLGGDEG